MYPKLNLYTPPHPYKEPTSLRYQGDGTGRDSYIIVSSGGLQHQTSYGQKHLYANQLRNNEKIIWKTKKLSKDFLDYQNWFSPKQQAKLKESQELQKQLIYRLSTPRSNTRMGSLEKEKAIENRQNQFISKRYSQEKEGTHFNEADTLKVKNFMDKRKKISTPNLKLDPEILKSPRTYFVEKDKRFNAQTLKYHSNTLKDLKIKPEIFSTFKATGNAGSLLVKDLSRDIMAKNLQQNLTISQQLKDSLLRNRNENPDEYQKTISEKIHHENQAIETLSKLDRDQLLEKLKAQKKMKSLNSRFISLQAKSKNSNSAVSQDL